MNENYLEQQRHKMREWPVCYPHDAVDFSHDNIQDSIDPPPTPKKKAQLASSFSEILT